MSEEEKMLCPNCQQNDMILNHGNDKWECNKCNYSILKAEFDNGYVLWFCDNCGAYLNNQPGFDSKNNINKCVKCDYVNDTSESNIKELEKITKDNSAKTFKEWIIKNRNKLLFVGGLGVSVLFALLLKNNVNLKKEIEKLRMNNVFNDMRIKQLVELCNEKDDVFNQIISDGLRHGSSKAAQQMSWKKAYLKSLK